MNRHFAHFGELYKYLENSSKKEAFLYHHDGEEWKVFSKEVFLLNIRYLALAVYKKGWEGKQVAIAVSSSPYWVMIDYALMLAGAVSVPLFTNISSRNLRFQLLDLSPPPKSTILNIHSLLWHNFKKSCPR